MPTCSCKRVVHTAESEGVDDKDYVTCEAKRNGRACVSSNGFQPNVSQEGGDNVMRDIRYFIIDRQFSMS